jgi:hypothetical protein
MHAPLFFELYGRTRRGSPFFAFAGEDRRDGVGVAPKVSRAVSFKTPNTAFRIILLRYSADIYSLFPQMQWVYF